MFIRYLEKIKDLGIKYLICFTYCVDKFILLRQFKKTQ